MPGSRYRKVMTLHRNGPALRENFDREILDWDVFGEASRALASRVHDTGFVPDYVWRATSKWITFPWSSLPPVIASPGHRVK